MYVLYIFQNYCRNLRKEFEVFHITSSISKKTLQVFNCYRRSVNRIDLLKIIVAYDLNPDILEAPTNIGQQSTDTAVKGSKHKTNSRTVL